jgi:CheY-like chemotaxis protein
VDLSLLHIGENELLRRNLLQIQKAGQRSATLVSQLLGFARKQIIRPHVLELNDTVSGILEMLRRLIGENIELAWIAGRDLWPVRIDPSQLDQLLANLIINARDAIVGVGKVTIETQNVVLDEAYCTHHLGFVPGAYVLLAVSDNGYGMAKETLARIFEPFFTTKGLGKGTGLGLATVYGIIKQNSGFINVYSELGEGTTFKIYLPRFEAQPREAPEELTERPLQGGNEAVLLVEDEEQVLELCKTMLEGLGYAVLSASTPSKAIRLAEEHTGAIHLLITDVVMPEMNGRELAKKLSALHPGLKCLYVSGYTVNVIARHGILDEGVHFVEKPFSVTNLARKVREALESREHLQ